MILKEIEKSLKLIKGEGIYPDSYTITGASTTSEVIVNGNKVTTFCSNNYLGIASDLRIKKELSKAVEVYGMGSGGSRLVSGNIDIQEKLEKAIANFKETESAITFVTGYMTNTGVIPALVKVLPTSHFNFLLSKLKDNSRIGVFSDELNHASIVDGCIIAKADRIIYKHNDIEDLEQHLKSRADYDKKLIITDGIFSMDGDIAPLDKIVGLAEKYDALVMVDDAHATGILGNTGRGTAEYYQIKSKALITMGTFTKVFGGIGGFIVGPTFLTDYLRVVARTYVFTAPIPPAIAHGLLKAIEIVKNEPERRVKLLKNVSYLNRQLHKEGFNTLDSQTQIIPVLIGDEKKAMRVSSLMLKKGFFTPSVRWPATAHGSARLRLTLMSDHTAEQIDSLVRSLIEVRNKVPF